MRENFFNLEFNADNLHPMNVSRIHGTTFMITGKVNTNNDNVLTSIELKYNRLFGIINFALYDIVSVTREKDPKYKIDVVLIQVQLRAFADYKHSKVFDLTNHRKVKVDPKKDIIHLKIVDKLVDIDEKDDITPYRRASGWGGHCHSSVRSK